MVGVFFSEKPLSEQQETLIIQNYLISFSLHCSPQLLSHAFTHIRILFIPSQSHLIPFLSTHPSHLLIAKYSAYFCPQWSLKIKSIPILIFMYTAQYRFLDPLPSFLKNQQSTGLELDDQRTSSLQLNTSSGTDSQYQLQEKDDGVKESVKEEGEQGVRGEKRQGMWIQIKKNYYQINLKSLGHFHRSIDDLIRKGKINESMRVPLKVVLLDKCEGMGSEYKEEKERLLKEYTEMKIQAIQEV